jgi:hypothetical protein
MKRGKYVGTAVTFLSLMASGTLTVFAATSATNSSTLPLTSASASTPCSL